MPQSGRPSLHLVSDSTGETLYAMGKAALARFAGTDVAIHMSVFVRSDADVETTLRRISAHPGPVFHTLVDPVHRARVDEAARAAGQETVAVLDPVVDCLARHLGRAPEHRPGMQHRLNDAYFERIAALDFAIAFDDGALGERLKAAHVILTGVSRTSKTPTCIYLAYRGIKAANMPLVPRREPDPAFFEAMAAGIPVIGLTASPARLAQVRSQRLEALGDRSHDYADIEQIRAEVADARLFFQRHGIPVIDVTRRSIEETAAEIQAILHAGAGNVE
ncbi:kinase/pyrophosphorylase [Limibaculum sp. FT325]|uniref:pyruvate, water dikinase regulatory protein n=1 Tax=Thermohalobaculum sediminis TaxID=2939436 RepID=UPI0020BFCEAD|nr:pyruvate, water dikinase regulatory protein [Limibaculum sediminis]MCL5776648.1 kinase/pyrophosphorylase [Limibaculum sediminis]